MPSIGKLESKALTTEKDALYAVFAQINAEVRKQGKALSDDDGSFYVSRCFKWKTSINGFFDAYHRICDRKQVEPIYQESALTTSRKVPFAELSTVNLLYGGVLKRLRQFRDKRIPPFNTLSECPTLPELRRLRDRTISDKDIHDYLAMIILIIEELTEYVRQLDQLTTAYRQRLEAFVEALDKTKSDTNAKNKYDASIITINKILGPYIKRLKENHALPSIWSYSFANLPLTKDGERYLNIHAMSAKAADYWARDVLPTQRVRDIEKQELERIRKKAEEELARKRRREKIERLKERIFGSWKRWRKKRKRRTSISVYELKWEIRSLWNRFDWWIEGIGDWLQDNADRVSEWSLRLTIWAGIAFCALTVILAWLNDGFLTALVAAVIMLALYKIILGLSATVGIAVKYAVFILLFLFRFIFYNGTVFLISIVSIAGLAIYYYLHTIGVA